RYRRRIAKSRSFEREPHPARLLSPTWDRVARRRRIAEGPPLLASWRRRISPQTAVSNRWLPPSGWRGHLRHGWRIAAREPQGGIETSASEWQGGKDARGNCMLPPLTYTFHPSSARPLP